jgi:hypothetical protein
MLIAHQSGCQQWPGAVLRPWVSGKIAAPEVIARSQQAGTKRPPLPVTKIAEFHFALTRQIGLGSAGCLGQVAGLGASD